MNVRALQNRWRRERARRSSRSGPARCRSAPLILSEEMHAGSCRSLLLCDIVARLRHMQGQPVEPGLCWDSFGAGVHIAAKSQNLAPAAYAQRMMKAHRQTIERLGLLLDTDAILDTSEPAYVKWVQELFLLLWSSKPSLINPDKQKSFAYWDPGTKSNLALKQIVNGRGFHSGMLIEIHEADSYVIPVAIKHCERLLQGLDSLQGWEGFVKNMQRKSIGLEDGIVLEFPLFDPAGRKLAPLRVFSSHPDTVMGTTFLAVAADHILAQRIAVDDAEVKDFCHAVMQPEYAYQRLGEDKSQDGIELGVYAINPVNGDHLPVWATNFIVSSYGTGAALGVPGHDQRNYNFAIRHRLPIRRVALEPDTAVDAPMRAPYTQRYGRAINSGELDKAINRCKQQMRHGSDTEAGLQAKQKWDRELATAVIEFLADHGIEAQPAEMAQLRGWKISQQDYWGHPVPLVHCGKCGTVPVPAKQLPLQLPTYQAGKELLSDYPSFVACKCPRCGGKAERDTDTLSSYFDTALQHLIDPGRKLSWQKRKAEALSHYCCGVEHATHHLLTARIINQLLRDQQRLSGKVEPFGNLLCQGTVLNYGLPMAPGYGNAIGAASLLDAYGADLLRLHLATAADPRHPLHWDESKLLALQGVISNDDLALLRRGELVGLKADKAASMLGTRELRRLQDGLLSQEEFALLRKGRLPAEQLRKVKKIASASDLVRLQHGLFSAAQLRRLRKGALTPGEQAQAEAELSTLELRRLQHGLLSRDDLELLLQDKLSAKRMERIQAHWPAAIIKKLQKQAIDPRAPGAIAALQEQHLTKQEEQQAKEHEELLAIERKARKVLDDNDIKRLRYGLLQQDEWQALRQSKLKGTMLKRVKELLSVEEIHHLHAGLLDEDEFAALLDKSLPAAKQAKVERLLGKDGVRRLRKARAAWGKLAWLEQVMPMPQLLAALAHDEPTPAMRKLLLPIIGKNELGNLRQAAAALPAAHGWQQLTAFLSQQRMAQLLGFLAKSKQQSLGELLSAAEIEKLRDKPRLPPPLLSFLDAGRMDRICNFIDETTMNKLVNYLEPDRMEQLLGFEGFMRDLFTRKRLIIKAGTGSRGGKDLRRQALHRLLQAINSGYGLGKDKTALEPQRVLPRLREMLALLETAGDADDAADASFAYEAAQMILQVAHPLLPHLTEELWASAGFKGLLLDADWPRPDARALRLRTQQTYIIQENGTKRLVIEQPSMQTEVKVRKAALAALSAYVHARGYPSYPRPGERIHRIEHAEMPQGVVINFVLAPAS